jgi:hypothetical protein
LPINRVSNDAAKDGLKDLIRSERAVALAGAGVSAWAGYPLWHPLINRLVDFTCQYHPDPQRQEEIRAIATNSQDDLVTVAKTLANYLAPRHFKRFLTTTLGPESGRMHDVLPQICALPFRDIFTLNLDPYLEYAHVALTVPCRTYSGIDTGDIATFLKSADERKHLRHLIYLHGRFSDELNAIALTTDGYDSVYREESFTILMTIIAATRRVVFLGFGFEDSRLLSTFERTARTLADPTLCHYAVKSFENVANEENLRNEYRTKWNVEIVFYELMPDDPRGLHAGFLDLMAELGVSVDRRYVPAAALATAVVAPPPHDADEILERITSENLEALRGNDV